MIKPTPGRIVWFVPGKTFQGSYDGTQALAGIITYVHSDRMINVSVFDQNGIQYAMTSIPLVQPEDKAPPSGWYAYWMPYQIKADAGHQGK